jgi:hypothetical protein
MSDSTNINISASIFGTSASRPYNVLFGSMVYTTRPNKSIRIPSKTKVGDSFRVLFNDSSQYNHFKHNASFAPAFGVGVDVQDARGNVLAKYVPGRISNNTAGTVKYTSNPAYLFSDMVFPDSDDVIIALDNYMPFQSCNLADSREFAIREDFRLFSEKYDLKKVTMFVTQTIGTILSSYNLDQLFKQVVVTQNDRLTQTLCEYLFGATLSGSEPSFQGFLNFGPTTEIVYAEFTNKVPSRASKVTPSVRTNGRLQLNLDGSEGSYSFTIVIKTPDMLDHITESETKSVFSLDNTITERLTSFDEDKMAHLLDMFRFSHLLETTPIDKREQLLMDCSDKVIDHLFFKKNTLKTVFEPTMTLFEKTEPLNDNYLFAKFALKTDAAIQANLSRFMRSGNDSYYPLPPSMGLGLRATPSEGPFCERQYSCAAPSFSYSADPQ